MLINLLLKQGQCRHPLHKCQRSENSWLIQELQCTRWVKRIWHNKKVQTPNSGYDSQWCVQSFEEAQIYVHDLGSFVTVQLRDETPSVLTPRTLFEDHGHSYEWVIGQKPRLTNEEKIITCKIDTSLLSFRILEAVHRLNYHFFRDESSTDLSEEQRKVTASGNGSVQSPQKHTLSEKEEHKTNADDLKDTETLAPAQVSQDSDSERTTKVSEKWMMHTTFTHFPKSRDCDVCLRTK